MHEGEVTVAAETVAALVAARFPDLADLPVRALPRTGTVNAVFRVGEVATARFPLVAEDADVTRARLAAEATAIDELHAATVVPSPRVLGLGEPGGGFPMPWLVQTWVPGTPAWGGAAAGSDAFARDLAGLIGDLRAADPLGRTFTGANRGGDLRDHDAWMGTCLRESVGLLDTTAVRALWDRLRVLPRHAPDGMCHGDLTPGNVLVAADRLAGVVDTGEYAAADPALDLVAAWHLLDDGPRETLRRALGCDDLEWARGAAWAVEQAMGVVWYYRATNPPMAEMGERTLRRLLAAGLG